MMRFDLRADRIKRIYNLEREIAIASLISLRDWNHVHWEGMNDQVHNVLHTALQKLAKFPLTCEVCR